MKPVSHTSCDELYCCESCNKHPQLENEGVYLSGAFLICGMCHNRLMQSNCEVCGCSFQAFIRLELLDHISTSRHRPKSAPPYLRLKNSKWTSKCQSILFSSTPTKLYEQTKSQNAKKTERGGTILSSQVYRKKH